MCRSMAGPTYRIVKGKAHVDRQVVDKVIVPSKILWSLAVLAAVAACSSATAPTPNIQQTVEAAVQATVQSPVELAPSATPAPTSTIAAPKVIARWSGSAIKTTETFSIPTKHWRISWDTKPGSYGAMNFQIFVYHANGEPYLPSMIVANVIGANRESSIIRDSGDFYLMFNTAQPYTVIVEALP